MPKVNDTYYRTVELFWTGNYRTSEIARMLGVSRQRIHQIIHDVFTREFIDKAKQKHFVPKYYQRKVEEKYGMPYEQYAIFKAEHKAGRRWHILYTECVQCGTTKVKYWARGMCCRCYPNWAYCNLPRVREGKKRAQRNWNAKNKDKLAEYNTRRQLRIKSDPVLLEEHRCKKREYYYRKKREKEEENQTHIGSKSESEGQTTAGLGL